MTIVDRQRILQALDRPATTLGVLPEMAAVRPRLQIHTYDILPSTNTEAWAWVDRGAGAGTVVIADRQASGRGQWGREWASLPGGLYLSLVLEPEIHVRDRAWLTLASAWGVAIALENLGVSLGLKWPNDLVSPDGRKLGGILTETRLAGEYIMKAVVGIGVNWSNPVPPQGASLQAMLPPSRPFQTLEELAAIVVRGMLQGYQMWQHQGTEALTAHYQTKLINLGQRVTVNGHSGEVLGVSDSGDLAVCLDPGAHAAQSITLQPGEIALGYNAEVLS